MQSNNFWGGSFGCAAQVYPAKNGNGSQQPLWLRLEQNIVDSWRKLLPGSFNAHAPCVVGPLALCCTPALTQKPIICGIVARSMPAQEKPNELLQVAEEQLLSLEKQMMFGQSCVWNQWWSMCIWSLEAQAHEDPWWEARRDRERKAEESEWYHVIYYLPMCHFTVSTAKHAQIRLVCICWWLLQWQNIDAHIKAFVTDILHHTHITSISTCQFPLACTFCHENCCVSKCATVQGPS